MRRTKTNTAHKSFIILGLVLSLFSLASCTRKNSGDPNTLYVALASPPATLDPRFATDAYGMRIAGLLFNSLVRIDADLNVIGDAAESWEFKGKTYTFVLKNGLKFSNGRAVTKEDILFSFDQYRLEKNPFFTAFKVVESVKVDDTTPKWTISITLKEFSAPFLSQDLVVAMILPKAETEAAGADFAKNPIGTGSFKLAKQDSNEILMAAVEDHPYEKPKIKNLSFKIVRDDLTRFQKVLRGEIDIAQSELPLGKIKEFEKNETKYNVLKKPSLSMTYLLINMKDPILKDFKTREAIALGINRTDIIRYKLEGFAQPATSILTPGNPFQNETLKNIDFDQAKAKSLLGALKSPIKLALKSSNTESTVENAKVITQQLRDIGIDTDLQSFEWGTYYDDVKKGNFQMALMRWVGVFDPDIYRLAFHSKEQNGGRNRGRYTNLKLDKALDEGLRIADPVARIKHYRLIQEVIHNDLPIIPLWYEQQVAVTQKNVKGYDLPRSGDYQVFKVVEKSSP